VKRKGQSGQAFILALILLAIGALVVIPTLTLTTNSLKNSRIIGGRSKSFYAVDAAQEFVMWKLLYTNYPTTFITDNQSDSFYVDVCGAQVGVTVIMRAVAGQGSITLATNDVMQPTKTVSPTTAPNRSLQTITYIIRLEQLSSNTSQGLDAIYDILPQQFNNSYLAGSSYISVDGGAWQSIGDPLVEAYPSSQDRLRWPASGSFAPPIRDFAVRQVKELKFQIRLTMPPSVDDTVKYNYVVIKVGSITTFSGPQAPLKVGNGTKTDREGMLTVTKEGDTDPSEPGNQNIIRPGVIQDITYTISVSNNDTSNHNINTITDYLPPEFLYVTGSTVGFGNADPTTSNQTINGVLRQVLVWTPVPAQKQINSGQTRTLTFVARTTQDVSGSYYNEVLMDADFVMPAVYSDIGVSQSDFQSGYSWNSGTVIVPAYDSSASSGNVTSNANLAVTAGGAAITSYQIR